MSSTTPYAFPPSGRVPIKTCQACEVRHLCLPDDTGDGGGIDQLVQRRYRLLRGEHLYQANDLVQQRLYAIQSGQFKIYQLSPEGQHRVSGFRSDGDFLGLECLGLKYHRNSVVALNDAVLCEFSYPHLVGASLRDPRLAQHLSGLLLAELAREQAVCSLLCESSAERKLAGFLQQLSAARLRCGKSGQVLELTMTRTDIGDYLGLAAATVSRTLKRFHDLGYLSFSKHKLTILDHASLRASPPDQHRPLAAIRTGSHK